MIWPTMGTTESTSLWEVGVRGVEKPLRAVSGLAWAKIGLPTRCATCCATRCSLCCARCTCCKWPKLSLHHSLLRNHSLVATLDKLTSFFVADNVSAKTSIDVEVHDVNVEALFRAHGRASGRAERAIKTFGRARARIKTVAMRQLLLSVLSALSLQTSAFAPPQLASSKDIHILARRRHCLAPAAIPKKKSASKKEEPVTSVKGQRTALFFNFFVAIAWGWSFGARRPRPHSRARPRSRRRSSSASCRRPTRSSPPAPIFDEDRSSDARRRDAE